MPEALPGWDLRVAKDLLNAAPGRRAQDLLQEKLAGLATEQNVAAHLAANRERFLELAVATRPAADVCVLASAGVPSEATARYALSEITEGLTPGQREAVKGCLGGLTIAQQAERRGCHPKVVQRELAAARERLTRDYQTC